MQFKNRIGNKISDIVYTSTEEMGLQGAVQGTGNGGTHWTFIRIPMIETIEQTMLGCTIQLSKNHKTWEVKMLGFGDNKKYSVNNILKQLQQTITEVMQRSIKVWNKIPIFVGGKSEMIKYNCHILDWTFDKSDKPKLNNNKEKITFLSKKNIQIHS